MSQTPRALVVFNPCAGQAQALRQNIDRAADIWRAQGWQVELSPTLCAGDATRLAKEAVVAGFTIVVAAGGDGTVNEVINGLVGTEVALAVLPAGTVNIWAREMGLPMDLVQVAKLFLQAQPHLIDVGQVSGGLNGMPRHFLLMAGVGFDAAVAAKVNPKEKKLLGAIAYVKQAVQMAWQYQGSRIHLRVDGVRIRGRVLLVIIGNSQLYGGVIKFTAHALINDGLLDVCVIKGHTLIQAPLRLFSVFARTYHRDPKIEYFKARQVQFLGRKQLPVQLDGDYVGKTPMSFEVIPHRLWVLVPPNADRSLWQNAESLAALIQGAKSSR